MAKKKSAKPATSRQPRKKAPSQRNAPVALNVELVLNTKNKHGLGQDVRSPLLLVSPTESFKFNEELKHNRIKSKDSKWKFKAEAVDKTNRQWLLVIANRKGSATVARKSGKPGKFDTLEIEITVTNPAPSDPEAKASITANFFAVDPVGNFDPDP